MIFHFSFTLISFITQRPRYHVASSVQSDSSGNTLLLSIPTVLFSASSCVTWTTGVAFLHSLSFHCSPYSTLIRRRSFEKFLMNRHCLQKNIYTLAVIHEEWKRNLTLMLAQYYDNILREVFLYNLFKI